LSKESLKELAIERGKMMQKFATEIERLKGLLEKEVRQNAFGIKEEDVWQQYKKHNQL